MATYIFSCRSCGATFEADNREPMAACCTEPALRRNYRAEGVGFAVARLSRERKDATTNEMRDMFLPTADEFIGPDDPDGSKGIEQWNETHIPAEGNYNPVRPERPLHSRKTFPVS